MSLIGDILKKELEKRGWSQHELARRAGMSQPALAAILKGTTQNPRMKVVSALAAALGLSPLSLIGGSSNTNQVTNSFSGQAVSFITDRIDTLEHMVVHNDERLDILEAMVQRLAGSPVIGTMGAARVLELEKPLKAAKRQLRGAQSREVKRAKRST